MIVKEVYSHKGGKDFIERNRSNELEEVKQCILSCSAVDCLEKISFEKTKPNLLFSPIKINEIMKGYLSVRGWTESAPESKKGFREPRIALGNREFREMDGIKNKVGLEIQFGKYAFMAYDIFSKMPIFYKRGLIDCGIELVVMPEMIKHMSTGVSSFRQIEMEMIARGVADLDIPTLVLGIGLTSEEEIACNNKRLQYASIGKDAMIKSGAIVNGREGARPGPKKEDQS